MTVTQTSKKDLHKCLIYDNLLSLFNLQYDVKNQRLFLKRTKCDDIHQEDLFVGNRVNVFSRQLNLTDYGDQYTANKLGSKKER